MRILLVLAAVLTAAPAHAQQPDSAVYVFSAASELAVNTSKAGVFGLFGHSHRIRALAFAGSVVYVAAHPESSTVSMRLPTDSLTVVADDTSEVRKVGENMKQDVLEVAKFPEMSFVSQSMTWSGAKVHMKAGLTMHGQTHPVEFDAEPVISADTIRATVRFKAKQTDFGMHPFSTAAGTVKVGDEVEFDIKLVAVRRQP